MSEMSCSSLIAFSQLQVNPEEAGIDDLPDEILMQVLQAACPDSKRQQMDSGGAHSFRRVCKRWCRLVGCRARLNPRGLSRGVRAALDALTLQPGVTSVALTVSPADGERKAWGALLRGLVSEFPRLTRLRLTWQLKSLEGLVEFLRLGSGLTELHLALDNLSWPETRRKYQETLQSLDLGNLTQLESLTLDFVRLAPPRALADNATANAPAVAADMVPVSPTLLVLPSLRSLRLRLSHARACQLALPDWLGELSSFRSLALVGPFNSSGGSKLSIRDGEGVSKRLFDSFRGMHSLQELALVSGTLPNLNSGKNWCCEGDVRREDVIGLYELLAISELSSLASLELKGVRPAIEFVGDEDGPPAAARAIEAICGAPQFQRLSADSFALCHIQLPRLEELSVKIHEDARFALAPGLRSLTLSLCMDPASIVGPLVTRRRVDGQFRWQAPGVPEDSDVTGPFSYITGGGLRRQPALQALRLEHCGLLRLVPGVFELGPLTSVALRCHCHARRRLRPWVELGSHAEYAREERPCQYLTRANALKLFHDTRPGGQAGVLSA
eukprot:jgi/Mesen1/5250/ME000263S04358